MRKKLVWSFWGGHTGFSRFINQNHIYQCYQRRALQKQVLTQSQQQYDSRVIPFKRGDILDKNGTILATSEKGIHCDPGLQGCQFQRKISGTDHKGTLPEVLGLDEEMVRAKLTDEETKSSQYQILKKELSITDKRDFEDYCDTEEKEMTKDELTERQNVKGYGSKKIICAHTR